MLRYQYKEPWIKKKQQQANMTSQKNNNNKALITGLKEMEIHELWDKEFRITLLV